MAKYQEVEEKLITTQNKYVHCPFCKESDFDLIGLKYHLLSKYCEVFEKTEYN